MTGARPEAEKSFIEANLLFRSRLIMTQKWTNGIQRQCYGKGEQRLLMERRRRLASWMRESGEPREGSLEQ